MTAASREFQVLAKPISAVCNLGCPKDRRARTPDGEEGLNHLCAGFKHFFTHSAPYLHRMVRARTSRRPMEAFMRALRAEDAEASRQTGRNDACPCGSGKNYKRRCLAQ